MTLVETAACRTVYTAIRFVRYRVFIRWFNPRVSGCSPEESQLSWPGRCRAVRSGKLKRSGTTNAQRTAGVASDILQYAQYRERWCRCTCATPRYEGTPQNMTWISSFGLFLNSLLVVFLAYNQSFPFSWRYFNLCSPYAVLFEKWDHVITETRYTTVSLLQINS